MSHDHCHSNLLLDLVIMKRPLAHRYMGIWCRSSSSLVIERIAMVVVEQTAHHKRDHIDKTIIEQHQMIILEDRRRFRVTLGTNPVNISLKICFETRTTLRRKIVWIKQAQWHGNHGHRVGNRYCFIIIRSNLVQCNRCDPLRKEYNPLCNECNTLGNRCNPLSNKYNLTRTRFNRLYSSFNFL